MTSRVFRARRAEPRRKCENCRPAACRRPVAANGRRRQILAHAGRHLAARMGDRSAAAAGPSNGHQREWRSGAICRFWSAGRGRQRSRFCRPTSRRAGRARLDSSQSARLRVRLSVSQPTRHSCRATSCISWCGAPRRPAPISPARLPEGALTRYSGFGRCGCVRIYGMRWSPREYARSIRGLVDTNSRPSRFPIVR